MGFLSKLIGKDNKLIDVLDILEMQHKEVDALIEKIEKGDGNRSAMITELADNLAAHASAEELVFYPFIMAKEVSEVLHESVEEHLAMKRTLADLLTMTLDNDQFKAKLALLKEQVAHHAHEEEEKELFPVVKDMLSRDERAALGNEVLVMFEDLMQTHPYKNVPAETAYAAKLPPVSR